MILGCEILHIVKVLIYDCFIKVYLKKYLETIKL